MQQYNLAEPMLRRSLEIFLKFYADTRRQHWHQPFSIKNYRRLLMAMGNAAADAQAQVEAVARPLGVTITDGAGDADDSPRAANVHQPRSGWREKSS